MAPGFGLIGIGLAIYCWLRRANHHCVYPLVASLFLFILSVWRFLAYLIGTP